MKTPYTTIIVDDEAPARLGLENLLKAFPETFQVIDTAENVTTAKEKIEHLKPDIIFLDIEMPGQTGFDLLAQLQIIPMVVFCTAYDEYALKAFETNSVDYLVKPVKESRLKKTVEKLKTFNEPVYSQDILSVLREISALKQDKKMTSITVKKNNKLIFVKLDEVAYFEASDNYTTIHCGTQKHLSSETISALEQKLPDNFLRIHRGIIINKDFVKDIQKYFNSRYTITLNNSKQSSVTSGRSYNAVIKDWIDA
ncbi:LytTR family DNA-binding domain-containing protein [Seonamhaeicola sp. ML3]|uniref:LytR/AlgR family response regulator transcription factor n=1 Tax=Seonamhaeicola sp. ML3 TaxID=2937786 RepID=UPI00200DFCDE|nr:LytTR family DNA-binding domain-containing protein [Seonamhaeicola sp. ML3]